MERHYTDPMAWELAAKKFFNISRRSDKSKSPRGLAANTDMYSRAPSYAIRIWRRDLQPELRGLLHEGALADYLDHIPKAMDELRGGVFTEPVATVSLQMMVIVKELADALWASGSERLRADVEDVDAMAPEEVKREWARKIEPRLRGLALGGTDHYLDLVPKAFRELENEGLFTEPVAIIFHKIMVLMCELADALNGSSR